MSVCGFGVDHGWDDNGCDCRDTVGLNREAPATGLGFGYGLAKVLDEVERVMHERHKKYGPGNINRHGIRGVMVRMDDKIARVENTDEDFTDESYRDAWLDLAGYGLIGLMLIDGTWPA
jgi:hypothetical protein